MTQDRFLLIFDETNENSVTGKFLVINAIGGERGIRTPDEVAPMPPFQGGTFNRSAISPIIFNFSSSLQMRHYHTVLCGGGERGDILNPI